MHAPTPRAAIRWGFRALWVFGTLTLATLAAWVVEWPPAQSRPQLLLMVYMLLVVATLSSVLTIVLAYCHLAVHDAFAAGLRTGQAAAGAEPPRPAARAQDPVLRLVE